MRRGLKRNSFRKFQERFLCFKPIPDEEGTETHGRLPIPTERSRSRASNRSPMRRGLKPQDNAMDAEDEYCRFKPIPDEEGTETR